MRRGARALIGATVTAITLAAGLPSAAEAASGWTLQTTPLPSGTNGGWLTSVSCPSSGFCMAANGYGAANGAYLGPAVEVWNGSSWSAETLPTPSTTNTASIAAVSCASATSCVAVGSYPVYNQPYAIMAEIWNGSSWTPQTLPPSSSGGGTLYAISCASATRCVAVGAGGSTGAMAELWNGSRWREQNLPVPATATQGGQMRGISCFTTSSCTAVGMSFGNGTAPTPLVERWNGASWTDSNTPLPSGGSYGSLLSVSCTSASACFAAGGYDTSTTPGLLLAEHLSHGAWSPATPPMPSGATSGGLSGISCITGTGGVRCTAVGTFSSRNTKSDALADYWNGHAWSSQPTAAPVYRKMLAAVSCVAGGGCEAVGQQTLSTSAYEMMLAEGN